MKQIKQDQAALLRAARAQLKYTNEQLASALGKSLPTLLAWLAPKTAEKHRVMPKGSMLLLERIVADVKKKRQK